MDIPTTRLGRWVCGGLVCVIAICPFAYGQDARTKPKHRVVYNDDAQALAEAPAGDVETFLREFLRREVSPVPITTFCFLAATPDICTYDSKVGEVYGDRSTKAVGWAPAIRALRAKGTDVLKLVIDELRPRGIEILAAIRMNDTHHRKLDRANPGCPVFAIEHPEYVIKQPDGRTNETALDYSYPGVREHRLAIMRELAEGYDLDGLELNFCRWGKHFPRHQGRQKAPIMTAFVARVREILDQAAQKRGRKRLTLGIRVPETIRACWIAGLDPRTWVTKGWIDYLVVSTFNETDPQVRVEPFASFTRGTRCELLVAMGNMMGGAWQGKPRITGRGVGQFREAYWGMLLTDAEARACAANYYAWGADGIAFWNIACNMGTKGKFSSPDQRKRMWSWMNAVIDPKRVGQGPRRYHYLPLYKGVSKKRPPARNYAWYGEGMSPLGIAKTQILRFAKDLPGQRQVYHFRMADGRKGEKLRGALRFSVYHITPDDCVTVDVNGEVVDPDKIKRTTLDAEKVGLPGVGFGIALEACPAFRGDNELGIALEAGGSRETEPYMEVLDIVVQGR